MSKQGTMCCGERRDTRYCSSCGATLSGNPHWQPTDTAREGTYEIGNARESFGKGEIASELFMALPIKVELDWEVVAFMVPRHPTTGPPQHNTAGHPEIEVRVRLNDDDLVVAEVVEWTLTLNEKGQEVNRTPRTIIACVIWPHDRLGQNVVEADAFIAAKDL